MEGYIKLHRSIFSSEINEKPAEWFKIWTFIIWNVNWEDKGIYKRWEIITNNNYLCLFCRVSPRQVEGFLAWARACNMIETQKLSRGVKIKVINFEKYQLQTGTEVEQNGNTTWTINKQEEKKERRKEQTGIVSIETTPKEETESFFQNLPENIDSVVVSINPDPMNHDTIKTELQKFYNYWTEKNSAWTKQRWQMEKTFEVKRRLATWFSKSNFNSYQKPKWVLQA